MLGRPHSNQRRPFHMRNTCKLWVIWQKNNNNTKTNDIMQTWIQLELLHSAHSRKPATAAQSVAPPPTFSSAVVEYQYWCQFVCLYVAPAVNVLAATLRSVCCCCGVRRAPDIKRRSSNTNIINTHKRSILINCAALHPFDFVFICWLPAGQSSPSYCLTSWRAVSPPVSTLCLSCCVNDVSAFTIMRWLIHLRFLSFTAHPPSTNTAPPIDA